MLVQDVRFAVVDVETTGLFATMHDRIVEIGVVNIDGHGRTLSEYGTLVNPERDVGATHVHGIHATDVVAAPRFKDIAGDVYDCLSGSVIAAHNAPFDLEFLAVEFDRVGIQLPKLPAVCTLELACQANLMAPSRRLVDCCAACGIPCPSSHVALEDARAAARLLLALIDKLGASRIDDLGCLGECLATGAFPNLSRTSIACTRQIAGAIQDDARGYLARLVSRMPLTGGTEQGQNLGTITYLEFLDRVLEDRHITASEAEALVQLAARWGMSQAKIKEIHGQYLRQLVKAALADEIISESERRDLTSVAEWLGLADDAVAQAIAAVRSSGEAFPTGRLHTVESLRGKSVCFTGAFSATIRGQSVTREMAEEMAKSAGITVLNNVTRRLDFLVAADPLTQSGKAAKARAHGIRIVAEDAFWRMLGAPVD